MTRKEKVAQVEPMAIDDDFEGRCLGMPVRISFFRAGRCGPWELYFRNIRKVKEVRL